MHIRIKYDDRNSMIDRVKKTNNFNNNNNKFDIKDMKLKIFHPMDSSRAKK